MTISSKRKSATSCNLKAKVIHAASALALSLTAFALQAPAHAQEAAAQVMPTATKAAAPKRPGKPALWKVADDDTTIYLFGTVHLLPSNIDWQTDAIKQAMQSSSTLVTEADTGEENKKLFAAYAASDGTLPAGVTVRDLMSDDQRAKYEAGLKKMGIPPKALDQMEPWMASIALTGILTQASGMTPDQGAESVLEATMPEGTDRGELETALFQLQMLDGMPTEVQVRSLVSYAENPQKAVKSLQKMVELWAKGDPEGLGTLINNDFAGEPVYAERLLYNRNANWAEWIDERLDEPGTVFVAVGAGHLGGDKSVQDYLKQRGIETVRVQ